MLTEIKHRIPWWSKIAAKLVLSRSHVPYSMWKKLGVFRHGRMDNPRYALDVFQAHIERVGLRECLQGMTVLEIGPGDSVATAIISKCHGARAILVDVGPYSEKDLTPYFTLCELLRKQGLEPPDLSSANTLQDVLSACDGEYLTEGLVSWRKIPSESVDLAFSHAVLQHVPKEELLPTMLECRRVMRPHAFASHTVDLRDMLGGALNNLRFNEQIWESNLVRSSGFYTNRIRYSDMLRLFDSAGFIVEKSHVQRWNKLPTSREKLAFPYRQMSDDELSIKEFNIMLKRKI
jgi:hypothetical protein